MCDTQLSVHLAFSWSFVGVSKSKRAASGTRFDLLRVFCLSALKAIFSNSNDALSLDGNLGFAYVTVSSCSAVEGVTCQTLTLDLPMHHLALSSDELTLSVCGAGQETVLTLDFYDVRTFFNKVFFLILLLYFIPFYFKRKKQHCSKPLTHLFYLFIYFLQARQGKCPFASFKAGSEPDTLVQDLKWSPVEAFRVAACLSDGSMMVLDVTEKVVVVAQLPASVGITCGECVFSHFSYLQLVYSHVEFFIS